MRRNESGFGFVYVLKCGPYYKIGYTKNPDKRIKQLGTQPPFESEVIRIIASQRARLLEQELHGLFSFSRVKGEWFELDEMDFDMLMDVMKTIAQFYRAYHRLSDDYKITPTPPPSL